MNRRDRKFLRLYITDKFSEQPTEQSEGPENLRAQKWTKMLRTLTDMAL